MKVKYFGGVVLSLVLVLTVGYIVPSPLNYRSHVSATSEDSSPYRVDDETRTTHFATSDPDHVNRKLRNKSLTALPNQYRGKKRTINKPPTLHRADIDTIETFVFFVGWSRSCHSFIGSLLDAHPNVIIAHEYHVMEKIIRDKHLMVSRNKLFNELYSNSYRTTYSASGWRNIDKAQKGYSLNIDGWWQGRFTNLKVIGDKCGGTVSKRYDKDPKQFMEVYQVFSDIIKVPIKVLQVIRNPFDMIATDTLYRASKIPAVKVKASPTHKCKNYSLLNESISAVLRKSRAVFQMVPELKLSPLEVHCEDLISYPAETMSTICQFLGLECSREYLQMSVDKTFKNVSASHLLVQWDPATLPSLKKKIMRFPFFQRYINTEGLL